MSLLNKDIILGEEYKFKVSENKLTSKIFRPKMDDEVEGLREISGSHGGFNIKILWDLTPCSSVDKYKRFRGNFY
jgi:hypothetical protein